MAGGCRTVRKSATGSNPTDRGKPDTKRHLVADRRGIPLAVRMTGANVHDSTMFAEMLDAIPAVRGKTGRLRSRPEKCHADKGYDYPRCREECRSRGIDSKEKFGRHRWVVERDFAWLNRFRRLKIRYSMIFSGWHVSAVCDVAGAFFGAERFKQGADCFP